MTLTSMWSNDAYDEFTYVGTMLLLPRWHDFLK